MTVYGYILEGDPESTSEQIKAIANYPYSDLIIESRESKTLATLQSAISKMNKYDRLIVLNLKLITKNLQQFKSLLEELRNGEIHLISVVEKIDTSKDAKFYDQTLSVLTVLVEKESSRRDSQIAYQGRPTLAEDKISKIQSMYKNERKTMREISEILGVSLGAVHKYIKVMK